MYVHLRQRQEHGEKCTAKACGSDCGFQRFEEWLRTPVTEADAAEDARIKARAAVVLAGDI
ncbi:hypothetical protein [Micromonospora sp. NPDC005652]|uniref:hypothetical protein n=1 Tax=Micromonospora sp. NPDC005652 TaxID=3157046 RepID=UPI0033D0A7CD